MTNVDLMGFLILDIRLDAQRENSCLWGEESYLFTAANRYSAGIIIRLLDSYTRMCGDSFLS